MGGVGFATRRGEGIGTVLLEAEAISPELVADHEQHVGSLAHGCLSQWGSWFQ